MKEAAAAYGRLLKLHSDDHMLVASAIVAAAECDPSSAKKYEAMLPELTSASGLDAEELEAMDPPRTKRFRDGGKVKDSMHDVDEEERAKILEARPAAKKSASRSVPASTLNVVGPSRVMPSLRWEHVKSSLWAAAGGKGA